MVVVVASAQCVCDAQGVWRRLSKHRAFIKATVCLLLAGLLSACTRPKLWCRIHFTEKHFFFHHIGFSFDFVVATGVLILIDQCL